MRPRRATRPSHRVLPRAEGEERQVSRIRPRRIAYRTRPGDVVDVQLPHDPRAVGLGGPVADAEQAPDLLHVLALGDELQHLALPRAQRVGGGGVSGEEGLHDGP